MTEQQPSKVVVAVPALNEQRTLTAVLRRIRQSVPDACVVVVDDGSTDRTAEEARSCGVVTLVMPFNVGVGGAMRTAFLYAHAVGATALVQVDADGQHDPSDIPALLESLDHSSVVVGNRFSGQAPDWVGGSRRIAMKVLARLISRITGTHLDDVTSGFRAADSAAIRLFARAYPSEYLGDTIESLVLASRAGLKISQVPVQMSPRQSGEPSQNPVRSALFLGRALLAVLVAMTHRGGQRRAVVAP